MKNHPSYYLHEISLATESLDKLKVEQLCHQLIEDLPTDDEPFPAFEAKMILLALRKKKFFNLMIDLADAFLSDDQTDPQIIRQYGQALINQGKFRGALSFLSILINDSDTDKAERNEALGLIGRIHKQSYINKKNATHQKKGKMMEDALNSYLLAFQSDRQENRWHGINVVALLCRASRDGLSNITTEDAEQIATKLVQQITELDYGGFATLWDYAIALEASIALKNNDTAIKWAEKYIGNEPDAFELSSTIRQLEEVWEITPESKVGGEIISLLSAALLAAEDGALFFTKQKFARFKNNFDQIRLEKVFGDDSYKRIKWMQLGLERAESIGLICRKSGKGIGTGFLIKGSSISKALDDNWYFLTNSHVLTNDEEVIKHSTPGRKPLRTKEAYISFDLLFDPDNPEYEIGPVIWTSPPDELDATLVQLESIPSGNIETYQVSTELPDLETNPRLYIVGHPNGGDLSVSLQDNFMLEFNDNLVQYRTPTDPGSSGSPIFNEDWALVGIHHAGSFEKSSLTDLKKEHEANEGIRISAIIEKIDADLAPA